MSGAVGFGGSTHDFATCLITADNRVVAIEDERLSRVRHSLGEADPCRASLRYCQQAVGPAAAEISSYGANDLLVEEFGDWHPRIEMTGHHYTHALSTFFTSPYDEAAVLVVDGAGSVVATSEGWQERETTSWMFGRGNELTVLGGVTGLMPTDVDNPDPLISNSVGDLYRVVTEAIGFKFLQAGKTMGLAPYGDERFVSLLMSAVELESEGRFTIDINGPHGIVSLLEQVPRGPVEEDLTTNARLAFSVQSVLETVLFHVLGYLWEVTRSPNLCLAGGVALNCVANGKITTSTPFENVHVVFAPGDSGTALGSAVHCRLDEWPADVRFRLESTPYTGQGYSDMLDGGADVGPPERLYRTVASLLREGKVVAWFQGGAEFGPRALGNRSLLASPAFVDMPDRLNRIKHREWFRPVAPVVLEDHLYEFFEATGPSPYMSFSWPVRPGRRSEIPGACHVDGSGRVQTVSEAQNPELFALVRECQRQDEPPVLINTSLNLRGEPIVETPDEAFKVFLESDIDALVINDRLYRR